MPNAMSAHSSGRVPRLYVTDALFAGGVVEFSSEQTHYLVNVRRLTLGSEVRVFNGRDGEWSGELSLIKRRACELTLVRRTREQGQSPDIHYLFAPLKKVRTDFIAQKVTELGVRSIRPVFTEFTQAERVNLGRLQSNAIEAAEQCGLLTIPEILEPITLEAMLEVVAGSDQIIFCDEAAAVADPIAALAGVGPGKISVLIGPEGGFSERERALLMSKSGVTAFSLGPRIMRADTAGIAALTLINAVHGDWR